MVQFPNEDCGPCLSVLRHMLNGLSLSDWDLHLYGLWSNSWTPTLTSIHPAKNIFLVMQGPCFRIGQIPGPEELQGYEQDLGEGKIYHESHSHLFNSIEKFGESFPIASIGQMHVSTLPWPTLVRTECAWDTSKLHHCPWEFYMNESLCLSFLLLLTLYKFSTLCLKCLHWFSHPISFC